MSPTLIGITGIVTMLVFFLTRMPVAYVMMMVGFVGFSSMISLQAGLNLLSRTVYESFSAYGLTTIPLFILMGQIAFNSGINRRLYHTAYKYLGHTRGGLAMATVSACTAFGAVCGSSPATAATMATVGLPEMKRYRYADELAAGAVASGGGLGMIMPPSVVLIVYGVMTEQSIGELFVAGIIPALLITLLFILAIFVWCRLAPQQGPPRRAVFLARADPRTHRPGGHPGGVCTGHRRSVQRLFHSHRSRWRRCFRRAFGLPGTAAAHLAQFRQILVRNPPDIVHGHAPDRRSRGFREISRRHPYPLPNRQLGRRLRPAPFHGHGA